jgi:hypothetical protein
MSAKESVGYYELKQHKPWFDEGCSELLDQRKQAKLQWLQDPSEINGHNLKNVRRETSRHFRNKKREYQKTNSVALSPRANYTDRPTAACRPNLVSTFVDRGVLRGQRGGSPTVVNLSFLDRSRYFSFK